MIKINIYKKGQDNFLQEMTRLIGLENHISLLQTLQNVQTLEEIFHKVSERNRATICQSLKFEC